MSESAPKTSRSFAFRLLRWLALLSLLLFIAAAIAAVVAWNHRTELVASLSRKLPLPVELEVDRITTKGGTREIRLEGLRVFSKPNASLPPAGARRGERTPMLSAESATWRPDLAGLPKGSLGAVVLESPVVRWKLESTESTESTESSGAAPAPDSPRTRFHWSSLSITDGEVFLSDESGPLLAVQGLFWTGGSLHSGPEGMRAEPQKISIEELELTRAGGAAGSDRSAFSSMGFVAEFSVDDTHFAEFKSLKAGPSLFHLDDELLQRIQKNFLRKPGGQSDPGDAPLLTGFHVAEGAIDSTRVSWSDLPASYTLPPVLSAGQGSVRAPALSGLSFRPESGWTGPAGPVSLSDLRLGTDRGEPDLQIASVQSRLHLSGGFRDVPLEIRGSGLVFESPRLDFEKARWTAPRTPPAPSVANEEDQPRSAGNRPIIVGLESGEIHDGHLTMMEDAAAGIPSVDAELDARVADWANDGAWSKEIQSLNLRRIEIRSPEASLQQYSFSGRDVIIDVTPEALVERREFKRLAASSVNLVYRGADEPSRLASSAVSPVKPARTESPSSSAAIFWEGLVIDEVAVHQGTIDFSQLGEGVPGVKSGFELSGDREQLELSLSDLGLHIEGAQAPFYTAHHVTLKTRPEQLWREHRLGEVSIDGGRLLVDEQVQALASPSKASEGAVADGEVPTGSGLGDWTFDRIVIGGTRIHIKQLTPLLPDIEFQLETQLDQVPLDLSQFDGEEKVESVRLSGLRIPSPYGNSLNTVADLSDVVLQFTMKGLLRKEIERVEIVKPRLNVGKPLFWYIDYYRRFGPGGSEAPPVVTDESGWTVGEVAAIDGRIHVTPFGIPIPGFTQPFPFTTTIGKDTVIASLEIPKDTYVIEQLPLSVIGLSGSVKFNLPVPTKDNNLVEVLKADKIVYKQFEGTNYWVSVTYDEYGIYADFGGDLYGGYLRGGFNIYIENDYTWDAWISATSVDAGSLSSIVTPEYFVMTGKVDVNLVANGDKGELLEGRGDFKAKGGGDINVAALDEVYDKLPAEWEPLRDALVRAGLRTVQNFTYDEAEGDFVMYGREGELDFHLSGPSGKRTFEVRVHDYRR